MHEMEPVNYIYETKRGSIKVITCEENQRRKRTSK